MKKKHLISAHILRNRYINKEFIFYLFAITIFHILAKENYGDSINFFSKALENSSLLSVLISRYETWSSRLLIETPLFLLSTGMHVTAWRIADIFMCSILFLSFEKITGFKNNRALMIIMLLYPVTEMVSSGWIATTINYLWPLSAGVLASISLYKISHNEQVSFYEACIYLLATVFCANFELFAVLFLIITIVVFLQNVFSRKMKKSELVIIVLQMTICITEIIFALKCPGNWFRKQQEITYWMKDYASLTFIDQIVLGVDSTVIKLIRGNIQFFVLSILSILLASVHGRKNTFFLFVSGIPCASILISSFGKTVLSNYYPLAWGHIETANLDQRVDAMNYLNISSYFPTILSVVIILCIMITLLCCIRNTTKSIVVTTVFFAGVLTRVAMGLSPTIFASGDRTFLFLDAAMVYCSMAAIESISETLDLNSTSMKILDGFFYVVPVCSVVIGSLSIISVY